MYIDSTVPFRDSTQRMKHFLKHGRDFGAADEFEYERMADAFMSQAATADIYECFRKNPTKDRVRLDAMTRFFGVGYAPNVVRTLHLKDRAKILRHGGPAGFVAFECAGV